VACFNCIPVCPESGIGYRRAWPASQKQPGLIDGRLSVHERHNDQVEGKSKHGAERRNFLRQGTAWLTGLAVTAVSSSTREWPTNALPTTVPVEKQHPVAPPGAGDFHRLHGSCIACQLCISACPSQVLQPSLMEYGARGVLQPYLDFRVGYCSYECKRCGDVCPTGSIQRIALEAKKRVKIGDVRFIEDNCIVVTEKTACGACAEHCPTKAVHMAPYEAELTLPELDTTVCVGCGACEYACPVQPYKAIYVDGEPVHRLAEPPRSDTLDWQGQDDFPF
jgi:formate hydrogenlyase subunit 6/NADH:ubiquinone oxidoreductase subunit I